MIIWINGIRGIGKSTISEEIAEKLKGENIALLHSDEYFVRMLNDNMNLALGTGTHPYDNKYFSDYFCKQIESELEQGKKVIVDMALIDLECKENIFNNLNNKYVAINFILVASIDNLAYRIHSDNNREEKKEQIEWAKRDIEFLNKNFRNGIFIDTNNKSVDEIASEIIRIIHKEGEW